MSWIYLQTWFTNGNQIKTPSPQDFEDRVHCTSKYTLSLESRLGESPLYISNLKALIPKLCELCETLSGTRQRPQLPSTCCQDLGRGCYSDTLQKEGVHLTPECLHKVEMSAQFDMVLLNTLPEQFCIIRSWTYSPLELENIISKLWPLASASLVSQKILRSLLVAESSSVISWLPEPEQQQPSRAQVGQTDLPAHPASLLPLPFLSRRPGYLTLSTVII